MNPRVLLYGAGEVHQANEITMCITSNGQPRQHRCSESEQHEISDSCFYQFVTNGAIRWISALEMFKTALKSKDALQLCHDHRVNDDADPLNHENCLNAKGWIEVKC